MAIKKYFIFVNVVTCIAFGAVGCSKKVNTKIETANHKEESKTNTEEDIRLMLTSLNTLVAKNVGALFNLFLISYIKDEEVQSYYNEVTNIIFEKLKETNPDFDKSTAGRDFALEFINKNRDLIQSKSSQVGIEKPEILKQARFSKESFEIAMDFAAEKFLYEILKYLNYDESKSKKIIEHYKANQKTLNLVNNIYRGPSLINHIVHLEIGSRVEYFKNLINKSDFAVNDKSELCTYISDASVYMNIYSSIIQGEEYEVSVYKKEPIVCTDFEIHYTKRNEYCQFTSEYMNNIDELPHILYCGTEEIKMSVEIKSDIEKYLEIIKKQDELSETSFQRYQDALDIQKAGSHEN